MNKSANRALAASSLSSSSLPARLKTTTTTILFSVIVAAAAICGGWRLAAVEAVAPTIDYSHNMRILKLPAATPIGTLVYRLKGSDGDPSGQLQFGVAGLEARALLDVVPVAKSWNEADVYLRTKPDRSHYNLTVFVTDGHNQTTQVESTILITERPSYAASLAAAAAATNSDDYGQTNGSSSSSFTAAANPALPFLNTRHVFHVPETAKAGELVGSISVLESDKSDLPVRFELRGKGSEKFSINYVFGPKGHSKGEIILNQELDYERQNLFTLRVLALNAWTDVRFDTRNVATMDIVITLSDAQDSAPIFRNLPQPAVRVPIQLKAGSIIYKCEAEDGDFADQRPINYALDASSPLSSYFDINKSSGEIKLLKSVGELLMHPTNAAGSSSMAAAAAAATQANNNLLMLSVFASEVPDSSSYDHLWPPMFARAELPLLLVDDQNEAPQFLGGWQTSDSKRSQVNTLHGYLNEWSGLEKQQQLVVRWFTNGSSGQHESSSSTGLNGNHELANGLAEQLGGRPFVLDLGLGSNGTFELSLEGADAELFQLEPQFAIQRLTTFSLMVAESANKSLFDHEHINKQQALFTLDIVARDFGSQQRMSSRIRCLIELIDGNDNWPQFETDLYSFSVYENAPINFVLGQVRARDSDSGLAGKISYVSLSGSDNHLFRLDPNTGQVTLQGYLDREKRNVYMFLVEARDSANDHGLSNYTQMVINVLDVNDHAPVFLQDHYDAVLLSDGTFYQPLQVKAIDSDEPGTANSQVGYEIIAGNSNEQFTIDSVTGVIYLVASGGHHQRRPHPSAGGGGELPSILSEPIRPHHFSTIAPGRPSIELDSASGSSGGGGGGGGLDRAGKIKPTHEIEESPRSSNLRLTAQKSEVGQQVGQAVPPPDAEQLPTALDLLMSLESNEQPQRQHRPPFEQIQQSEQQLQLQPQQRLAARAVPLSVPPITTLVVRAHDYGIPIRSSTVKVSIFNQALLTRSVSLILNGTLEQLEPKREAIERAFSSLTGSRALIESLDALSDSSSLSVARVRLSVPEHSLVDLTDLSALMQAIEYRQPGGDSMAERQPPHYYYTPQPSGGGGPRLNLSAAAGSGSGEPNLPGNGQHTTTTTNSNTNQLYSDIHSYALDSSNAAALERRLLIYIIIVGVCILALLFAWMIYYCCTGNENNNNNNNKHVLLASQQQQQAAASYRPASSSSNANNNSNKTTQPKVAANQPVASGAGGCRLNSPIANNFAKSATAAAAAAAAANQSRPRAFDGASSRSASNNNLLVAPSIGGGGGSQHLTAGGQQQQQTNLKPDHYSMYNGQVWFGPTNGNCPSNSTNLAGATHHLMSADSRRLAAAAGQRRASSAPSGGGDSLDSALHSLIAGGGGPQIRRPAAGQFFPNTIGYTRNVASMAADQPDAYSRTLGGGGGRQLARHHRRSRAKVGPLEQQQQQQPPPQPTEAKNLARNSSKSIRDFGHSNGAFMGDHELDLEAALNGGGSRQRRQLRQQQQQQQRRRRPQSGGSLDSTGGDAGDANSTQSVSPSSSVVSATIPTTTQELSLELDSDQELLGFDSSGTPIIATHTRAGHSSRRRPIVIEADSINANESASHDDDDAETIQSQLGGSHLAPAIGRRNHDGSSEAPKAQAGTTAVATCDRQPTTEVKEPTPDGASTVQPSNGETSEQTREETTKMVKEGDFKGASPVDATAAVSVKPNVSLMSELNERISGRRREGSLGEQASGAHVATSASSKRQLMLKRGKTRSQAEAAAADGNDADGPRDAAAAAVQETNSRNQSADDQSESNVSLASQQMAPARQGKSAADDGLQLRRMQNGELLEKESIFAITYNGLATDKLPPD